LGEDPLLKVVLEWCAPIIQYDFAPCSLEGDIKREIRKLVEIRKEFAIDRGLMQIFYGLLWSVETAMSLANRHKLDPCHYLKMSIERGWLTEYCIDRWRWLGERV